MDEQGSDIGDEWVTIAPHEEATFTFYVLWPNQPQWPAGYDGWPYEVWI